MKSNLKSKCRLRLSSLDSALSSKMLLQHNKSLPRRLPDRANSKPRRSLLSLKMKELRSSRRAKQQPSNQRSKSSQPNSYLKPPVKVLRPERPRKSLRPLSGKISLSNRATKTPSSKNLRSRLQSHPQTRTHLPRLLTIELSVKKRKSGPKKPKRQLMLQEPTKRRVKGSRSTLDSFLRAPKQSNRTSSRPKIRLSTTRSRNSRRWLRKRRQPRRRQRNRQQLRLNRMPCAKKLKGKTPSLSRRRS